MKFFRTCSIIFLNTLLILFFLETCFYFGRIFLGKSDIGFLINSDKRFENRKIRDDCQRMKTHPILNYYHSHNSKCKVFGSSKYDDYFIWYKKKDNPKKKLVILVSGGSTTDGFFGHISDGYTWPYILQKICEKHYDCQVINGGNGGYSTSQEMMKLITYTHLVPKVDYVISLNGINEIRTSRRLSGKDFELHPYLGKIQFTMLKKEIWLKIDKQPFIIFPNILSLRNIFSSENKITTQQKFVDKNDFIKNKKNIIEDLNNYAIIWENNVKLMEKISNNLDASFISFLQPTMGLDYVNVKKKKTEDITMLSEWKNTNEFYQTNIFYKIAREKCKKLAFCIDISEVAPPGENLYHDPRHHNSKGNKIIAEEIFNYIKKMENKKF